MVPLNPLARGEADLGGTRREAEVGVVLAEEEAVFSAAGEHPVGFCAAARYEVIDHHAEVGLVASEDERRSAQRFQSGVRSGDEPLPCRLLVAGGAVDLTREVQTLDPLRFQGRMKLGGRVIIILHRIARAQDLAFLQAGDGAEEFQRNLVGARWKPRSRSNC